MSEPTLCPSGSNKVYSKLKRCKAFSIKVSSKTSTNRTHPRGFAISSETCFMTEIVSENPNGILKPGMIAAVSVTVQKKENIITVPATALIQRAAGWVVFLVEKGKAKMTQVDIGVSDGRVTEVRTNLAVGDSLVVRGQFKLNDGVKVRMHGAASRSEGDMAQD